MATLKYIIKKQKKKNGKHGVYLRIIHNRGNTTIKTGVDVFEKEWVEDAGRIRKVKAGTNNIARLNNRLDKLTTKAQDIIYKLEDEDILNGLTAVELKNYIISRKEKTDVFLFWENYIDNTVFNSINTRKAHISGLSSFKKFSAKNKLNFEQITIAFLDEYENWNLRKGNKHNGFATHINMLKIIFNKAVDRNIVNRDKYPFGRYKVKTSAVDKRAITNDELNLIKEIVLNDKKLILAKDIFLISYYIGGIAFIDLCKLKYSNIKDGFIVFKRSKTKVEVVNKVCENLELLLKKYLKYNAKKTDYIFDFVTKDDFTKCDLEYKRAWQNYNNALKKLGETCGLKKKLTTYVARHTYATNALNVYNMPITYVKTTIGHKNIRTTQKYVDTFSKDEMAQYVNLL